MSEPLITVLLPVFNGQRFLRQAVNSILNQNFKQFELLIINDGSTDDTENIIRSFHDERIRYISRENKGLIATLNEGIDLARGKYIARMDADDIAVRARLEKQFAFMEKHQNYAACFARIKVFFYSPVFSIKLNGPEHYEDICLEMFIRNPLAHPTAFLRSCMIKGKMYYDPKFSNAAEDYELFIRISQSHPVYCLPEYLLFYRKHFQQITAQRAYKLEAQMLLLLLSRKVVQNYFDLNDKEYVLLSMVSDATIEKTSLQQAELILCFDKIRHQNKAKKLFAPERVEFFFKRVWLEFCIKDKTSVVRKLKRYFSLKEYVHLPFLLQVKEIINLFRI
ncbi:MAG: glycosyl transferase family 2 [Gammaproteobacteria bacterium]|jgi:glycosyltransferase involved in cell wall biosynthesis|nr:glycosyl transferase family 2 [Gammaproteobacteria bacterium]